MQNNTQNNMSNNTLDNTSLRREILQASFKNKWSHLPSAFSHCDYIFNLCKTLNPENTKIVFGKPFGSQGYYIPFKHFGFIDTYDNLSEGVKIPELKGVSKYPEMFEFSEETIGNALGVAIGVTLANPTKVIWCNISDASLQMGQTLEALLFILEHSKELKNLNVTIDYNGWQVLSELNPDITPIIDIIYKSCKINATFCSGYVFNEEHDNNDLTLGIHDKASFYVFNTIKGKGIQDFVRNPKYWHYQSINNIDELERLESSIYEFQ